jgi:hypothetical protein
VWVWVCLCRYSPEGVRVERGVELVGAQRIGEVVVTPAPKKTKKAKDTTAAMAAATTAAVLASGDLPALVDGISGDAGLGLDDDAAASVMQVAAAVNTIADAAADDAGADEEDKGEYDDEHDTIATFMDSTMDEEELVEQLLQEDNGGDDESDAHAAERRGDSLVREEVHLDFLGDDGSRVPGGGVALEHERVFCTLRRLSHKTPGNGKGKVNNSSSSNGNGNAEGEAAETGGEEEWEDLEEVVTPWLIGCDGGRSTARQGCLSRVSD